MRKPVVLYLLVLLLLGGTSMAQDLTSVQFKLKDINGKKRSFQTIMKKVRGTEKTPRKGVVVLSFWALWCQPCKKEMKAFKPIFQQLRKEGLNVEYIAINLDNIRSTAKVKSYVTAQKFPYIQLLDPNQRVFEKLNGQSIPYTLVLKESGALINKHIGFIPGDEKHLEEEIRNYLSGDS
ncbi:MAG: TlpA family protein disulfide reductase [Chlorobi bacterium]|nr:TlpA family protein disulfide reductase [Chlorobiota bacterium]